MLYAKVVLGLPVEGPFDYIVPAGLTNKIKIGCRAWVSFGPKKMIGYVVGCSKKSQIKRLKPLIDCIDRDPAINKNMLLLTRRLSEYYCCSWGEAIEASIPMPLRKGKKVPEGARPEVDALSVNGETTLVHDIDTISRWQDYISRIKATLDKGRSVLMLLPDINYFPRARELLGQSIKASTFFLYRNQPGELQEWTKIRNGKAVLVIGTRSAIFIPVDDLGLVIIDEEEDSVYKQDQTPHYHAREVAYMRQEIEKFELVLGSSSPSLESLYLARMGKIKYILNRRDGLYPEVEVIDAKNLRFAGNKSGITIAGYLQEAVFSVINSGGKALLFLNRKGFATVASCNNCGHVLKCQRCNINLVYHFDTNSLSCHYCNFKTEAPKICPECNAGYIRYSGAGTEKLESELARIFPQARVLRLSGNEKININDADIFVATQVIIRHEGLNFDLTAVLSIDNMLNRVDLRSNEKVFSLLTGLVRLTRKKIFIQTSLASHHIFAALRKKDPDIFYNEELKERKQLEFPPVKHLGLIKLRGRDKELVKISSTKLFEELGKDKKKQIHLLSLNPAQIAKLRGNFYWNILASASRPEILSGFLKLHLKDFRHSGIIVTVDIDPL